jgi:uncharacterized protein (TIGR02147 family)
VITLFSMQKLLLKQFVDYRSFLLAHFERTKRNRASWTMGAYAKSMGLKNTSSLTKILNGQRHPGPEMLKKMVRYFGFDQRESRLFQDLIQMHKSKPNSPRAKSLIDRLGNERHQAVIRTLNLSTFEVISKWHCLVLREMLKLRDFSMDPAWIAARTRFNLSPRMIEKAFDALEKAQLIKKNSRGNWTVTDTQFQTTDDIPNEAIKLYHESVLELAKHSVRKVPVTEREFLSTTITIDQKRVAEAKLLVREFRQKFIELFDAEAGDETYQFQMQFFPVTQPITQTATQTSVKKEINHE